MPPPNATAFPKGILMIGRFMILFVFSIVFRYYDIKLRVFQLPDYHLFDTGYNLVYIACGLLLLSKKTHYIRISLFIIAAIIALKIILIITGHSPIATTLNITFAVLFFVIHIFFFVYIRTKINQYITANVNI